MTRLIPDWEIRITNFGLGYVLMCLVIAIGATNTGNNGLYLVLAGMLSAMVVSGILSRRNVRGVLCEIEPVGEVVAGRPALLKIRFENRLATATAQGLFFLHEGLPGPLWVDPLKPGERREVMVEGVFPGGASTGRPTPVSCRAFRSGSFASTGTRGSRGRSSSTPAPSRARSRRCRRRTRGAAGRIHGGAGEAPRSGCCAISCPGTIRATCTGSSRRGCAIGSFASARRSGTAS